MSNDTSGTNDNIVSYGNAGKYLHATAKPDVIANMDGLGGFHVGSPQVCIQRMQGGVEAALRGNFYIVTENDLAGVHNDSVVVDKEPVAGFHVFAEAEVHRGLHIGILA